MEMVNGDDSLEIIQLESEDGETIDCVRLADLERNGKKYAALQMLTEDENDDSFVVALFRIESENDDEEVLVGMEEGPEFDEISAAFDELFKEMVDEESTKE